MDRKPRIAISPDALRALKVWAAIEDMDPGDLAGRLILDHMPARVRDALGENAPSPSEGRGASPAIDKRKRLADNPDALQAIKDMWNAGERNQAAIARQIGYHRATVFDCIARMKKAGELSE